tara:strand:+ start:1589 stop:1990 length:402 start_codon:yes stop_codon:yes gene_type:complete
MSKKITINGIGKYCEGLVDELIRGTVLNVNRDLKKESPVDTGRFRFSWQVGEGGPVGGVPALQGSYPGESNPRKINYSKERTGRLYSIHSNLPYAEPLARGHSGQAPAGWIHLIAKKNQMKVFSAWEYILKKN